MTDKSSQTPKASFRRKAACCLAALLVLGAAWTWYRGYLRTGEDPPAPPAADDRFALPEVTPARFRNAVKTVAYVGTRKCMACHRGEHKSYLQTMHSRSLGDVDVAHEPPDGECRHDLSGRSYRVYRDGTTLRLREFIQDEQGREVVLADHAARYALGSGNYSRMYLVQVGDFFIETPVTWYPRRKRWGMSAGYEKDPQQRGFSRAIAAGCLYCHAGRVETIGSAGERLHVSETAIGCERCHGPGELHVQERHAGLPIPEGGDDSIVNPRHLPRDIQEDICAQCHLSGSANVAVRGRSKTDFRPGMRMADFAVSYRIDRPNSAMTVSGQVQQMRLSRCYTESKTMTCTTCHDLHAPPAELPRMEHYRARCLSCHETASCKQSIPLRQAMKDNCITCHMPRGPTDIPHLSFTHHRVGIHAAKPNEKLSASDQLVPTVDVSHLPEHERLRLLGLANDIFAGKLAGGLDDETRYDPLHQELAKVFQARARLLLEEVRSRGLRDPDVEEFFSGLYWRRNPARCIEHAELVLQAPHVAPAIRKSALYQLATSHYDQGRYDVAAPYLEELVQCERNEISLMLLAICHQKKGNLPEAVRLIDAAIRAAPDRADLHESLATIYRGMGKAADAEHHMQRAKLLRQKVPQPG